MNRLHIFFFYDQDGVVDRYVEFMLRSFAEHCSRLVVVCNGKLTPDGRRKLTAITPDVIVRENKGFDVWAYRAGMDYVGWHELVGYDELIMSNHTIVGPVFPFEEMYRTMEAQTLDFWGLSKYLGRKTQNNNKEISEIPEHIQSHFIAVRKPMLRSFEFRRYWENIPEINNYSQAVAFHEAIFTKTFAEYGFRYDTYIKYDMETAGCEYPLMWSCRRLMETQRCPFFKRKAFFYTPYDGVIHNSAGSSARELFDYLRDQTDFDTDMIMENAIRTANMRDIKSCVQLSHILPIASTEKNDAQTLQNQAVCYLPTEETTEVHEASAVEMIQKLGTVFDKVQLFSENDAVQLPDAQPFVASADSENGVALPAPFETVCSCATESDLVAVVRLDKKTTAGGAAEHSAMQAFLQCIAPNKGYVRRISALFESNRYLGMLIPPPLMAHVTMKDYNKEDRSCHQDLKALADLLGVPFDNRSAVSPYDGIYWCRSSVLREIRQLISDRWTELEKYKRVFENEHSFTCALGILIQAVGCYSGWVVSDYVAEQLLENYDHQLRRKC